MSSLLLAALLALAPPDAAARALLAASDVSLLSPRDFRARVTLRGLEGPAQELEVWRAGEDRTLVRFLSPKDVGKYLLKREGSLYFLGPRAKKPVKLQPSYKLAGGVSLDAVLGTSFAAEYEITGITHTSAGEAVFDLVATTPRAPAPRARYVVSRETRRPTSVELQLKNGRAQSRVEFVEWSEAPHPRPRRLRVIDALRPRASAAVEIHEVVETTVPEALFDLQDPSARRALDTR